MRQKVNLTITFLFSFIILGSMPLSFFLTDVKASETEFDENKLREGWEVAWWKCWKYHDLAGYSSSVDYAYCPHMDFMEGAHYDLKNGIYDVDTHRCYIIRKGTSDYYHSFKEALRIKNASGLFFCTKWYVHNYHRWLLKVKFYDGVEKGILYKHEDDDLKVYNFTTGSWEFIVSHDVLANNWLEFYIYIDDGMLITDVYYAENDTIIAHKESNIGYDSDDVRYFYFAERDDGSSTTTYLRLLSVYGLKETLLPYQAKYNLIGEMNDDYYLCVLLNDTYKYGLIESFLDYQGEYYVENIIFLSPIEITGANFYLSFDKNIYAYSEVRKIGYYYAYLFNVKDTALFPQILELYCTLKEDFTSATLTFYCEKKNTEGDRWGRFESANEVSEYMNSILDAPNEKGNIYDKNGNIASNYYKLYVLMDGYKTAGEKGQMFYKNVYVVFPDDVLIVNNSYYVYVSDCVTVTYPSGFNKSFCGGFFFFNETGIYKFGNYSVKVVENETEYMEEQKQEYVMIVSAVEGEEVMMENTLNETVTLDIYKDNAYYETITLGAEKTIYKKYDVGEYEVIVKSEDGNILEVLYFTVKAKNMFVMWDINSESLTIYKSQLPFKLYYRAFGDGKIVIECGDERIFERYIHGYVKDYVEI